MKDFAQLRDSKKACLIDSVGSISFRDFFIEVDRRVAVIEQSFRNIESIQLSPDSGREFLFFFWASILLGRPFIPVNRNRENSDLLEAARLNTQASHKKPDTESIWLQMYTSGTSGSPRQVSLRGRNLLASVSAHAKEHDQTEDDIWLASLSPLHIGGMMIFIRAMFLHQTVVWHTFSAETFHSLVTKFKITGVSLVPTMLESLYQNRVPVKGTCLRHVLCGGAKLTDAARKRYSDWPIRDVYGSTETCSQIISDGKAMDNVEFRVCDDGRLALLGPQICDDVLDEHGWYKTNDLVEIHDGRVRIVGRADLVIISGGKKLNPLPVEEVLAAAFPGQTLVLIGLPDEYWGEKAVLVTDSINKSDITLERVRDILRESGVESFQYPKELHFLSHLPRSAIGKTDRQRLVRELGDRKGV